jgi:hypothetical protein
MKLKSVVEVMTEARLKARRYAMLLQVTTPNFEISITNGFEVMCDFLQNKIRASEL